MFHSLLSKIDTKKLHDIQGYQYSEKLLLADVVPAGGSRMGRTAVSNLGDFFCQLITGHFSSQQSVAGPNIVDDNISHLRGQLIDGAGQRKLFNDYIPFDLFLSPGRTKDVLSVNNLLDVALVANQADPSTQLFFPNEFEYIFSANSEILLDVRNDSNTPLHYEICFHGIRILSSVSVAGI